MSDTLRVLLLNERDPLHPKAGGAEVHVAEIAPDTLWADNASERLETLDPREVFEQLLPYAIALGVSSSWARQFGDIYSEEPPRWYVGHHHVGMWATTHAFESSLTDAMSTAEQSILSAPRSSGAGGGGFSGGGGGGGGGGSW